MDALVQLRRYTQRECPNKRGKNASRDKRASVISRTREPVHCAAILQPRCPPGKKFLQSVVTQAYARQSQILVASLSLRYNAPLKSDRMIMLGNLRACRLVAYKVRVGVVLHVSFPIGDNRTKVEVS